MSEIADKIKALAESGERVSNAAERLNQHFREVEVMLLEHARGSAGVLIPSLTDEMTPSVKLSFRRHGKDRALVIVESAAADHEEITPIASAALKVRVEAAKLLPQLIDRLIANANEIANSVETLMPR